MQVKLLCRTNVLEKKILVGLQLRNLNADIILNILK